MESFANFHPTKTRFIVMCALLVSCATSGSQVGNQRKAVTNDAAEQSQLARRVTKLQQRVQHLEQELAEQQLQLMRLESDLLPHPKPSYVYPPQAAKVNFMSGDLFGVNRGKKDGIRRGDHLIVLHRSNTGLFFKGQGIVCEVVDDELNAAGVSFGYAPGDEVYICNRTDARYSLSNATSP